MQIEQHSNNLRFGAVGSGWRSECYLKTAALLADAGFPVTCAGLVSRSAETRGMLSKKWGIPAFPQAADLLEKAAPDFLFVSVPGHAVYQVLMNLLPLNIPILVETPPAGTLNELSALYAKVRETGTDIQVAEQYWLQPMQQARLNAVHTGKIGTPQWAHISVNHSFHNISLIRKYLGTGFGEVKISAQAFSEKLTEGPGREGPPTREHIADTEHLIGILDFGGKTGLFDFQENQHRSWIRTSRVIVRGEKGEITDDGISWLKDYSSPAYGRLTRIQTGGDGNFEDNYLRGVMLGEDWLYTNPTVPARLSDEEISQAECLLRMADYVKTGTEFNPLAEAAQDHYLALLMREAVRSGKPQISTPQTWAE